MWLKFGRLAWLVGIIAAILAPVTPVSAKPVVTSLVLANQGGGTQLVLELSERADYRVFLLNEPMRLVVDLPPVEWRLRAGRVSANDLIAGYRFGQFDPDTARLVIDLGEPARVRRSGYDLPIGKSAHRLVLELERIPMDTFAAEVLPWTSSGATLRAVGRASAPSTTRGRAAGDDESRPPPPITVASAAASAGAARSVGRRADDKKVIVVDAGHGGVDPGAIGVSGSYEKDITLAIAREIRRQLEATGRYRAIMTRDDDTFLRLRDRVAKARAAQADLFVSVHADSIGSSDTRGASVYTLSENASDAEAAALAARENRADIIAGVDLSTENKEVVSILIDLAQRESMNLSAGLAALMVKELGRDIQLLPSNPHRFAGFAVLKAPDVPSVLLELGYLSNRYDEKLLMRPQHRRKIAAAILRAIDEYFARKIRS